MAHKEPDADDMPMPFVKRGKGRGKKRGGKRGRRKHGRY